MGSDFDELLRKLNTSHVTQAKKSRMGDPFELGSDRVIKFFDPMAVNVAPERRNAVQIFPPVNIDEVMTVAPADNAWVVGHPFLHLGERVPEVSVV